MASHSEAQMSRSRAEEAEKEIVCLRNGAEVERKKRSVCEVVLERKQASKAHRAYRGGSGRWTWSTKTI